MRQSCGSRSASILLLLLLSILAAPARAQSPPKRATVERRTLHLVLRVPFTVDAKRWAELVPTRSGIVRSAFVPVGTLVKKGQVLAEIETKSKPAQIVSPIDGVVIEAEASEGAYAHEGGAPLFTIVDYAAVNLHLATPETFYGQVRPGQHVEARVAAYPSRAYQLLVSSIVPRVDPTTHTFEAQAVCPNQDGALIIGMAGSATMELRERPNVLAVPSAVVQRDAHGTWVWRIDGGKARRTPVELGIEEGDEVEVQSGLKDGDQVASGMLTEGATVF